MWWGIKLLITYNLEMDFSYRYIPGFHISIHLCIFMEGLDRKDNLYAYVLSLMHGFTINQRRFCWIQIQGDLYLVPLTIGGHKFALGHEAIELLCRPLRPRGRELPHLRRKVHGILQLQHWAPTAAELPHYQKSPPRFYHVCQVCFTQLENLNQHAALHSCSPAAASVPCDLCQATFSRPHLRHRHIRRNT